MCSGSWIVDMIYSRERLGGIQKPRGSQEGEGGQAKKPRKTTLGGGGSGKKNTRFSIAANFKKSL